MHQGQYFFTQKYFVLQTDFRGFGFHIYNNGFKKQKKKELLNPNCFVIFWYISLYLAADSSHKSHDWLLDALLKITAHWEESKACWKTLDISSGAHFWPIIFTNTNSIAPTFVVLLKLARCGILIINRHAINKICEIKKIEIEQVKLELPLSLLV